MNKHDWKFIICRYLIYFCFLQKYLIKSLLIIIITRLNKNRPLKFHFIFFHLQMLDRKWLWMPFAVAFSPAFPPFTFFVSFRPSSPFTGIFLMPLQNCYKLFPSYCANWRFLLALVFVLTYRLDACQHVIKIAWIPVATGASSYQPRSYHPSTQRQPVCNAHCVRSHLPPFLECIYWMNENVKSVCEHQSVDEVQLFKIVAIMVYKL